MGGTIQGDANTRHTSGRAPVLVIGMHRSGTSLVTRLLRDLGLFIGWHLDDNAEAYLFRALNEWLLREAGATWQTPAPLRHLCDDWRARKRAEAYMRRALGQSRALTYLGPNYFRRYRTPAALPVPWGWKDPRTTVTLPLWLALFPRARVVHVVRHGVDVAESLRRREERLYAEGRARQRAGPLLYGQGLWSARADALARVPCLSLARGVALWEEYVRAGRAHVHLLGERACEVRYEDLLAAPTEELNRLAAFCGLPVGPRELARVAAQVRAGRAAAYREDPALRRFAAAVAPRLAALGFDSDGPC